MKSQLSFASSTASLVDSQRRFVAHVDPHHRSHPAPPRRFLVPHLTSMTFSGVQWPGTTNRQRCDTARHTACLTVAA